jgi:4-amino-4-deoxy-L-arabinose transferase-like glycosyltransferase
VRLVIGVLLLLVIMAGELALSVRQQSQTFDEACHIFAGYRYWKNSDFGINFEHPPLVKLVATVPLLWMRLRVPTIANGYFKLLEYGSGRDFLYSNDANSLLWRARSSAAVFTIGLAVSVFLVAYSMFGTGPAFLALTLLTFEPNILAHGALVTTDIAVALGLFLAVVSFYSYLKRPSAVKLIGAGLAAGLCVGVKHSGILIFPILLLLVLAELLCFRDPENLNFTSDLRYRALRQAASMAVIAAIALSVLWSLYGFRYAARPFGTSVDPPLGEFVRQLSPTSAAVVMQIAHWHLIPESYLYGVVNVYSLGGLPTVIFGKYYPTAQWFYFPAVFIIKSTLAFLLLCGLALLSGALWRKEFRREALFLLIPPALYLSVAMRARVNYGVRHLLPVYPFLIVLVAFGAWELGRRNRAIAALLAILVLFHTASSLRGFPNYIPYANELWGGPGNAHRVLADSNVDWGQGLKAMKQYIDRRGIKECWFAYFGSLPVDVSYYGIPCKGLPTSFADMIQLPMPVVPPQVTGPVFVSASEISGTYWRWDWINPYLPFQRISPSALIADSILVFDGNVDISQVSALTHESRAMQLMRAQKLDQALEEAQTAIDVAPKRAAAHAARSTVLAAMGRMAEADEETVKAQTMADAIIAAW